MIVFSIILFFSCVLAVFANVSISHEMLRIYESYNQSIRIDGEGFQVGMSLVFNPPLVNEIDYTLNVLSNSSVELTLKPKRLWRECSGFLSVLSATVDDKTYSFKTERNDGITVAYVIPDPKIRLSVNKYHKTQSKLLLINGAGFDARFKITVNLIPTSVHAYTVVNAAEASLYVRLNGNMSWLSGNDVEDDKKVIQVVSIDSGAGEVVFPEPITVGYIVNDIEGVVCDDSCKYAFDGVCDDKNHRHYTRRSHPGPYYVLWDDAEFVNHPEKLCPEHSDCTDCGGVDDIALYEANDRFDFTGIV